MSPEQYKSLVSRIPLEAFNKGNLAVIDEVLAPNFVDHVSMPGLGTDREAIKLLVSTMRNAFPDFSYNVEYSVAEGSKVAHYVKATGTHKGEFFGIAPSGKKLTWTEMHWCRFDGDKCVEHWGNVDRFSFLQQLGLIPALGQSSGRTSVAYGGTYSGMPGTSQSFTPTGYFKAGYDYKTVVRRWFEEGFNRGNLSLADQLFTSDYRSYDPTYPAGLSGPEGIKQYTSLLRKAFPDCTLAIEDQICEGDKVVTRWSARGTHKGDFFGFAPTGRMGMVTGIAIDRCADGKIAETWEVWDLVGLLEQLGVVPMIGQSK